MGRGAESSILSYGSRVRLCSVRASLIFIAANLSKMNKFLALGAFLAGITAFALFFDGSTLPLYRRCLLFQLLRFESGLEF